MKREWLISAILALMAIGGITLYLSQQRALAENLYSDIATWGPTPAAIRQAVGPPVADTPPDSYKDARHVLFRKMFEMRFRSHRKPPYELPIAVGLHFVSNTHIKLLCPARLEPWYTDAIALAAWQETRAVFGQPFDIDIYSTYIGIRPILIGTLRPRADRPNVALIVYHFPEFRRTQSQ